MGEILPKISKTIRQQNKEIYLPKEKYSLVHKTSTFVLTILNKMFSICRNTCFNLANASTIVLKIKATSL